MAGPAADDDPRPRAPEQVGTVRAPTAARSTDDDYAGDGAAGDPPGPVRAGEGRPVQPALHPAAVARPTTPRRPPACTGRRWPTASAAGDADRRPAARPDQATNAVAELDGSRPDRHRGPERRAVLPPARRSPTRRRRTGCATFVPCGAVAGVMARTDARPRRLEGAGRASTRGSPGSADLTVNLTNDENGAAQPARHQLPAHLPGRSAGWSGARAPCAAPTCSPTSTSTCPSGGWRCSSRRASTGARSGWCSSPTTSRCGRRSGSTSARSCRTCSGRARSRARRPREAYFVKCDAETTTAERLDLGRRQHPGRLRAAAARPSSSILQIQQIAGQVAGLGRSDDGPVQRQRARASTRTRTSSSG